MASLPHTPTPSTPTASYKHLGPALVGTGREAGARFANRENTSPPSAVHHSFRPIRDIGTGTGTPDRPQRLEASSNEQALEEVEQSPPGAFPTEEEEREPAAGEEVKNAVDAIRVYAKMRLPAALGIYVGDTKQEDRHQDRGSSPAAPDNPSTLLPEEGEPTVESQSRITDTVGASHNTNPFRDPEFMRVHGSRSSQQPDMQQDDSVSDVSRTHMTSTEVYPTTTRPSGYTDEPSAWTSPYSDTSVPPARTYDVVRRPSAGPSDDISSGFGGSNGATSFVEPVMTAQAVPFIAEPPLVVYSNTSPSSTPTRNETGQNETGPSGKAPIVSSTDEDQQSGASRSAGSSLEAPTVSDQEQSTTRDVSAEGNGVEESQPGGSTEAKPKVKGLLSKLNRLIHGKSGSNNEKPSKEEPSVKHSDSPQGERVRSSTQDVGSDRDAVVPDTDRQDVTPPSDTSSQTAAGARPVRIAEAPATTGHEEAHPHSAGFRRHPLLDVIPKHDPSHFDETIGPLPRHVQMRGKRELPSKEKPSGSRVGVGSLPGRREEAGVARLPDERNGIIAAPQSRTSDEHHPQTNGRENVTGVGVGSPSSSQAPEQRSSTEGSSSPASTSSKGTEQASEPRNGLLSGFLSEAEEILRDIGDVAWYYVPGFGNSSDSVEPQPPHTLQEPGNQSSPSPSPVAATTPTRAPPSSPVIGIQADSRQANIEVPKAGRDSPRPVAPTPTTPPSATDSRAFPTRLLATPIDPSSHPSRSSSAEEVNNEVFIVGPASTRERISGKQVYIASQLGREYVTSPTTFEEHSAAGAAGSLPWYPTETCLRALIGERMHDDQMRAAGAAEPEEKTTCVLTNPEEVPREESKTAEALAPLSPPSTACETKGLDVKSLGTPVGEGQQHSSGSESHN